MVRDGGFDDLEQLLLRVDGSNGQPVQQLDHQASKTLERSWDADCRAHFDQNTFGSVDVDLQLAGLVDGRIEEGQQALDVEVSSPLRDQWDV